MSNLQPFRRLLPSSPLSLCMKWSSGVQRETCCCLLWPFGPATNGKTVKIANKHKNLCANCASTLNGYAQDENLWAGDILANLRSPNHQWLVRAVCTLYIHISHIPYYQLQDSAVHWSEVGVLGGGGSPSASCCCCCCLVTFILPSMTFFSPAPPLLADAAFWGNRGATRCRHSYILKGGAGLCRQSWIFDRKIV